MESTEVVNFLSQQMEDMFLPVEIRVAAAEGLGYSGFSNGRDALYKMANNDNQNDVVRAAATRALGQTLKTSK